MNRFSKPQRLLLAAILLTAFAIRLHRLGVESLWYDETVSALLAAKPLAEMWAHTARDIHPPLYYGLLHFWTQGAGNSEFALAYFSLIFGLIAVALAAHLGLSVYGPRVGLMAALFMAINPFFVWYAQEVRMYSLGVVLLLGVLIVTWRILVHHDLKPGRRIETGHVNSSPASWITTSSSHSAAIRQWFAPGWRFYALYALLAATSLWTLYYTAFELAAVSFFVIPWLWRRARRRLWPWLLAQGAALLLFSPWLPIAARQAFDPPVPPWREAEPLLTLLARSAREGVTALPFGQSLDPSLWWPLGLLACLPAAAAFAHKSRLGRGRAGTLFLWVSLLGPLALILLASQSFSPLYHVRYLHLYSGVFPILTAAGLIALAHSPSRSLALSLVRPFLAFAFALALFAGAAISLNQYFTNRFQYEAADDLRGAVRAIYDHLGPRDAVLINAGYVYPAFLYYWPGDIAWMGRLSEYPPQPSPYGQGAVVVLTGHVDGEPDIGWGDPASDFYAISADETAARLEQLFAQTNTVWQLRAYDTVNDPAGFIRDWLEAHGDNYFDQVFPGLTYARVQAWRTSTRPRLQPPVIGHRLEADFEQRIRLLGYDLMPDPPQPGRPLRLTLYWRRIGPIDRPYKVFNQWLSANDQIAAQADGHPGLGAFPTNQWLADEIIESTFVLHPSTSPPPGPYRLITGFYDETTGQRLHLSNGDDAVILLEWTLN
ncbi:MAG: hypothetical protein GXP42_11625 [Chloroflexi bacterium]|nr:hypothetical protein [Chloroflexota bacterium]